MPPPLQQISMIRMRLPSGYRASGAAIFLINSRTSSGVSSAGRVMLLTFAASCSSFAVPSDSVLMNASGCGSTAFHRIGKRTRGG